VSDFLEDLRHALAERYTIEREIGRGGMAFVLLARDVRYDRLVALKILRPELAAAVGDQRFLREIRVAATLQHQNILPLYDSGAVNNLLYYVMPYVEGESLRDRLEREGQLPVDEALRIAREVADALSYAHSHDVVHRDIKPENILLTGGHALVADFGIARAITSASGEKLTETGIAIGTPAYMSPEQGSAEARLDGRADIYALGCVLYEMLAGEPPFTGPSAQAILARHSRDPVPPLRTVRRTIPEWLEAEIERALEKVPADRFPTAAQFAEALARGATTQRPRRRARRRAVALVAGAGALGTAAVLGAALLSRSKARPALDPNLVAVAPFDVLDQAQQLWREAIVDLLSASLDGAGPLRTVPPSTVVRAWSGRADPVSAAALGRSTGARLAVYGRVVGAGGDSVRLTATLLDVTTSAATDIEVRDLGSRLDRAADSLAMRIIRELGRTRPIAAVRLAGLGSSSVPALKAYLTGEQYYRRWKIDSAMVYYERAVSLDSSFALAWRRMAGTRLFMTPGTGDSLVVLYALRAGALNHGLAPRDTLLVTADSLFWSLDQGDPDFAVRQARLYATLEEATRRYPTDPEAWYLLGRARIYWPPLGMTIDQTLEAIDRSIQLDSSFGPAHDWGAAVKIALRLENVGAARRHLAAAGAAGFSGGNGLGFAGDGLRFAEQMLANPHAGLRLLDRWVDTASAEALGTAGAALADWPDSAETAVRIARALLARRVAPADSEELHDRTVEVAFALARRGHLEEAFRTWSMWDVFAAQLALFGGMPPESAAVRFARPGSPTAAGLVWWGVRRDTAALSAALHRIDSIARSGPPPPRLRTLAYAAARARAYLALAKADTGEAMRRFARAIDSVCVGCSYSDLFADIYAYAPLLSARGRDQEAERLLDYDAITVPHPVFDVALALYRGRVAERLGKQEKAEAAYRLVAASWAHGDPPLQVYVTEARTALRRLGANPQR